MKEVEILTWYKKGFEDQAANNWSESNYPTDPLLQVAYKHGGIDLLYGVGDRKDEDIILEIRESYRQKHLRDIQKN